MTLDKLDDSAAARRDRIVAEANALRQEAAELRELLRGLVKIIDDTSSDSEGVYPIADHTCIECTAGTSPHGKICAYHQARSRLGIMP